MKKSLIPSFILIVYSALLVKVVVFKIDLITIGHFKFRLADNKSVPDNFLPFKNILSYLHGDHGWLFAFLNLFGNIALFVPIGFLVPLVFQKITWRKSLILAVVTGFVIECMEAIFRVGIFDVDDIILNALGIIIGFWIFRILFRTNRGYKEAIARR